MRIARGLLFDLAVETLEFAIALSGRLRPDANSSAMEARLALYRQGRPFIGLVPAR